MATKTVETGRRSQSLWHTVPGVAALAALTLIACAPEDTAEFQDGEPTPTQQPAQEQTPDETADSDDEDAAETGQDSNIEAGDDVDDDGSDDTDALVAEVDEPVIFEECDDAEEFADAIVS